MLRTLNTLSLALVLFATSLHADNSAPFTARAGLDLAADAAHVWAPDARLIYLENDEVITVEGSAFRWGYLFHSETRGHSRGYSLKDGKILEASDLGFEFNAPPLPENWVDSAKALHAAEEKVGKKYRREHDGRLNSMLLIRGAFDDKKPNATTWTLFYTSATAPSLHVVVDAVKGKVIRTWRG